MYIIIFRSFNSKSTPFYYRDGSETLLTEFGISEVTDEWYDATAQEDMKVNLYDVIRKIMSYIC